MKFAIRKHQLVSAKQANRNLKYTCPFCHRRVILHQATVTRRAFFVHDRKANNYYNPAETNEHLRGKQQLFQFLEPVFANVKIEKYLKSINQWPDLIFGQTAIEFQCSPISVKRLTERLNGYAKLGIKSWWILGDPYYQRRLRATYLGRFMNYSRHLGFFLLFWRVRNDCLELHYQIREVGSHLVYRSFQFNKCVTLINFVKKAHPYRVPQSRRQILNAIRSDIMLNRRRLFHGDIQLLTLQSKINPSHNSLMGCPVVCHLPGVTFPIFKQRALLWKIWINILLTRFNRVKDVYRFANLKLRYPLKFCQIDAVKFYRAAFINYLQILQRYQYLTLSRDGKKIARFKKPRWFNSYYDKFKFLCRYRFR